MPDAYNLNNPSKDATHDLLFYKDEVNVEKSSADSAQSVVYFGHESTVGVRVVVKQYLRNSFKNMMREIKIFSLLEQFKMNKHEDNSLLRIVQTSKINDGLPELLGYKIG